MNTPRSPRRNATRMIMVALGLQLCLASHLWAFAVGELTVHSHRGEPFSAEVRLLLGPRERDKDVEVTLGNQEVYRAEGLRRAAMIDTLKAVMAPGTRDVIRLSSSVPIQASAFDMVLSVRTGQVTIVKNYGVTLPLSAPASAKKVVQLPTIAPVVPLTQPPKAIAKPPPPPRRAERYGPVGKSETLYSIAKALHAPNEKIWQAVVVLWRSNKGQFFAGNLHGLQAGTFLEVPSDLAERMVAMRTAEAQEIVANQWDEWNTPQHMGTEKPRVITTRDTEASAPPGKRATAATASEKRPVKLGRVEPTRKWRLETADAVAGWRAAATLPVEKTVERPTATQAVFLPVGKHGNMVSMTELQTVLQGLEERLMRRLTPTAQAHEVKSATAFVSTTELQASIQNMEERLTQRMQQIVTQTPTSEPVRGGQRPLQPGLPSPQPTPARVPYVLVLTNALVLLLIGALAWFWVHRRDREERWQRL